MDEMKTRRSTKSCSITKSNTQSGPLIRENAPGWNEREKPGPKQNVWSTSKRSGQIYATVEPAVRKMAEAAQDKLTSTSKGVSPFNPWISNSKQCNGVVCHDQRRRVF